MAVAPELALGVARQQLGLFGHDFLCNCEDAFGDIVSFLGADLEPFDFIGL